MTRTAHTTNCCKLPPLPLLQVANTLAKEVLTAPGNEVNIVSTNQV